MSSGSRSSSGRHEAPRPHLPSRTARLRAAPGRWKSQRVREPHRPQVDRGPPPPGGERGSGRKDLSRSPDPRALNQPNRSRSMTDALIIDAVRTPIGRYAGALSSVRPDDLAAAVVKAVVERTGVDPSSVDDVIFGCANQAGEDNRNVGRMAALLAGLPVTVPGQTVNRLCGSGLEAVRSAAHAIAAGEGSVFVAGGVESMSRAPWVMLKPGEGFARG